MNTTNPDVLIVGAGPAGLAAAIALEEAGICNILVIDRDDAPGGLPRFCHHPGFGWEYAHRLRTGPGFVRDLLQAADRPGIRIHCHTTMIGVSAGPAVQVTGPQTGHVALRPKAVILATGIRESNRGNRAVPGIRPERGIFTTGLLQQLIARGKTEAGGFRNLAVVGTEHVAFSALLTARHGGMRVRHMIEARPRIQSFPIMHLAARALGSQVHLNSEVVEILGTSQRVEGLSLHQAGVTRRIDCDGVIFSAGWIPETAALAGSGIECDRASGGVAIDQVMRTSLPGIFATGNLLRPVESSGWVACEGRRAGQFVARYIAGKLSATRGETTLRPGADISYVVPQYWDGALAGAAAIEHLRPSARVAQDVIGRLSLRTDDGTVRLGQKKKYRPSRRIRCNLAAAMTGQDATLNVE